MNPNRTFLDQPRRGRLRWLNSGHRYAVELIAWRGYEAIEGACAFAAAIDHDGNATDGSRAIYRRLLPLSTASWALGRLVDTEHAYVPSLKLVAAAFGKRARRGRRMLPAEIGRWAQRVMRSVSSAGPLNDEAFHQPEVLVRSGYRLLRGRGPAHQPKPDEAMAAWCLAGLGAVALMEDRICDVCFRCAVPSQDRCAVHSQAKALIGPPRSSDGAPSRAADAARRLRARLESDGVLFGDLERVYVTDEIVADLLWPMRGRRRTQWLMATAGALAGAPLVRRLLPDDFLSRPVGKQIALLRGAVDNDEWVSERWPLKIAIAQRWFAAEAATTPTRRGGVSDLNRARLAIFDTLQAQGKTPSEIAAHLGISRSHLSHIVRRVRTSDP